MIVGLGNDLIRVSRIERVLARHGQRFIERLLTDEERATLPAGARRANRMAKSFAAKEALVKALGCGFRDIDHRDCGVGRSEIGAPSLRFSPAVQALLRQRGISRTHLALTDDGDWVLATVILERD